LLISTLHTNDAPTTISRLTEMAWSASYFVLAALRLRPAPDAPRVQAVPHAFTPEGAQREIVEKALGG